MYLYFDKNGVLKEVINDKALRQGNYDVNKIYIYIEDLDYTQPQQMDVSYRLSDGTRIPVSAYELNFGAISENNKMEVPYNRRRDLKFFKYGMKYPFYEIPTEFEVAGVQYSALDIPGNVCCTVRVNNGTITTLGLIVFNVEETVDGNKIEYEEYISLAQFQYLMSIIVSKDYVDSQIEDRCICVVNDINNIDLSSYPVGTIIFSKNNRYYYIVKENNEKQFISSMNKVFKIGSDVADITNPLSDEIYELLLNYNDDIILYVEGNDGSKQYFKKAYASNNVITYLNIDEPSSGSVDFILLAYNKISINMTEKTWRLRSHTAVLYEKTYIDTQLALKADLSYVNNLVADIKANSFIPIDDYETYPSVQDFLDNYPLNEREEGSIYLYPVDTADLTKGYQQYIWEGNAWVYLGNTQLDLSNYYTKAQVLEKIEYIVEMTSSQQEFTGDTLTYLINNPNARIRYNGVLYEKSIESANSIDFMSVYEINKQIDNYQESQQPFITLYKSNGVAHAIKSIEQFYNKAQMDSLLDLKSDKTTTASLQNQINDLNSRLVVVEEAIVAVDTLTYTALSYSAIPNVSDNLYPIIYSGGLDTKEIKGNSFVHTQLCKNNGLTETINGVTITNNNNGTWTLNGTASADFDKRITAATSDLYLTAQHKYLLCGCKGGSSLTYGLYSSASVGSFEYGNGTIFTQSANGNSLIFIQVKQGTTLNNVSIMPELFDLTKDFGAGNEPTTYDQAVSMYASKGIDITNYVEYTQGTLIDSKPVKLISHGYNLLVSQPTHSSSIVPFNSQTFTKLTANKPYTLEFENLVNATSYRWCLSFYNENGEIINDIDLFTFSITQYFNQSGLCLSSNNIPATTKTLSITPKVNCYIYVNIGLGDVSATTVMQNVSLHLTGSRTGYAPYKAPIEYPITTEVLRSAGSVQDSAVSKKVGSVDLGTLNYTLDDYRVYTSDLANVIKKEQGLLNIVCAKFTPTSSLANLTNTNALLFVSSGGNVSFSNMGYNATTFKTAMSGVILNYELATPTEQTATLPTDIEIEKGGSLEVVYDNGNTTPADFVFDCAVYKPLE